MSDEAALNDAIRDLVIANRIMAREDVIDDFGHISARHPTKPDRYLLSRSRSPALVTRDDIMEFTMEGEPIAQNGRAVYAERHIHGALYLARPDVHCVAHHHARSVLPFTVAEFELKPLFHMASLIGSKIPMWDSQWEFGDTNMLVDSMPMGHSLAKALGPHRAALLRGHGAIVVGESIRATVFASVYFKENAELVLQARALGTLTYLTPGEIEKTGNLLRTPFATGRAWEYYVARAGFRGI